MTTATNNNKSAAATTNDAEPVHRTAPAPRVRAQRLIEDLFIETDSLKLVGARRGLSLDLLLKTLSTPEALDAMRNLRRLADERTALLLARARADAARRLIELACDDEPAARETARRACNDLLRVALTSRESADPHDDPATRAAAAESLRNKLTAATGSANQ